LKGREKIIVATFFLPLFSVIRGVKKKKYAIFFGIVLLALKTTFAWGTTWDDLRREMTDISSVQADFVQSKHLKILAKPLLSQGRFCFQKPDSVRWEYDVPVRSVLLMNKGKVKRYTAGRQGMTEEFGGGISSMHVIVQEISLWSQGRFEESTHFKGEIKDGKELEIILTPRDESFALIIKRIIIVPSPQLKGGIKLVKIVESEGNETLLDFSNIRLNEKISPSVFSQVD